MSGAKGEPKSRWQSIASSPAFLAAMCVAPIAFQAFHFRLRLFFLADWRYAMTFVAFSAVMGLLMLQVRRILPPKSHMEDREFDKLSLKNGFLLASIFAVYYLFDDYSDHSMNPIP